MTEDLMCMHANRASRRHEADGCSYPTTTTTTITIRGHRSSRLVFPTLPHLTYTTCTSFGLARALWLYTHCSHNEPPSCGLLLQNKYLFLCQILWTVVCLGLCISTVSVEPVSTLITLSSHSTTVGRMEPFI